MDQFIPASLYLIVSGVLNLVFGTSLAIEFQDNNIGAIVIIGGLFELILGLILERLVNTAENSDEILYRIFLGLGILFNFWVVAFSVLFVVLVFEEEKNQTILLLKFSHFILLAMEIAYCLKGIGYWISTWSRR